MKIRILLILIPASILIQFFAYQNIYAVGTQVLVKGTVTDVYTGAPVGITLMIVDSKGKKFKITSNSKYGTYEQLLTAGETYTITYINKEVLRESVNYTVEDADNYKEIKKNFKVKKLKSGIELFFYDIFNKGNSTISAEGKKDLAEFSKIMRFNRTVFFNMKVCGPSKDIVSKRIASLTEVTSKWRGASRRLNIIPAGGTSCKNDVVISVNKVEDIFNK